MSYPTVNFLPTTSSMGLQPIAQSSATQQHPLGYIIQAADVTYGQGEFIYLLGVASTIAGSIVCYNSKTGVTVLAVHSGATSVGPVAVAMSANVASQWGWYQISGSGPVNTDVNTVAANAPIFLTATAGAGDDAIVAGDEVVGLTSTAASSGGFTTCQLERPTIPIVGNTGSNTGDVTIAAFGSAPTAKGIAISAQVLTLEPADGTNPGAVSTTTQTFAGAKTFSGAVSVGGQFAAPLNSQAQVQALGSGTGITGGFWGYTSVGWNSISIDKAAWVDAALTQDITVMTLNAGARILAVYADVTTKFAGLAGTIALTMGTSAGGTEVLASGDVKTAAVTLGMLETDLGTSMVRTALVQGAYTPDWSNPTTLSVRLTSGTGNIGTGAATHLTTGVVSIYVLLAL